MRMKSKRVLFVPQKWCFFLVFLFFLWKWTSDEEFRYVEVTKICCDTDHNIMGYKIQPCDVALRGHWSDSHRDLEGFSVDIFGGEVVGSKIGIECLYIGMCICCCCCCCCCCCSCCSCCCCLGEVRIISTMRVALLLFAYVTWRYNMCCMCASILSTRISTRIKHTYIIYPHTCVYYVHTFIVI